MLAFLSVGVILGLSAGIAPGPLLALVISETMAHGVRGGIKVALAPILTDLPIIFISLFILARVSQFQHILGIISVVGACFLVYLGVENIRTRGIEINEKKGTSRSLQKGIMVNALSPHPYLFWISVGGPTTIRAMNTSPVAAIFFVLSFYLMLVGSKVILAVMVGKSRSFLQGNKFIFTMRLLGVLLIILAGILLRDGIMMLGLF